MKRSDDQLLHNMLDLKIPTIFGSTPTAYARKHAKTAEDLKGADAAFLGINWSAPVVPEYLFQGSGENFGSTGMSPGAFRTFALRHINGFLPEFGRSVFDDNELVDAGDIAPGADMADLLKRIHQKVSEIRDAGALAVTYGGNAGPSTYPVVQAIAEKSKGPVAILNFDAHGDNAPGDWTKDDPAHYTWAGTWVDQTLRLPNVDPSLYRHFGLRGPTNDKNCLRWFEGQGVKRDQIVSIPELKEARRQGFDAWCEKFIRQFTENAGAVWIGIDVDVLGVGTTLENVGDELWGPTPEEMVMVVHHVARICGPEKFAGLSFMAIPPTARSTHLIASWVIIYALLGFSMYRENQKKA